MMAMVKLVSDLPTGGPMAQVRGLGPRVGGRLALFCSHRLNRVCFFRIHIINQSINQSIHVYFRHMVHSYNNNNIIVIIITSSHGPGGQKALASAFSRAVLPNTVDVCCY